MADPIMAGMSAINLSWDTPYRFLASLLSLGCACVLWGWIDASSPLGALGQIGASLGVHASPDVAQNISSWLAIRTAIVVPTAWLLLLAGVAFNIGDGTGRSTIPSPWRGAPTALLALAIIWEVTPKAVPGLMIWTVVVTVVLTVAAVVSKSGRLREWLFSTFLNLFASAVFIVVLPLWTISRSPSKSIKS